MTHCSVFIRKTEICNSCDSQQWSHLLAKTLQRLYVFLSTQLAKFIQLGRCSQRSNIKKMLNGCTEL